MVNRLRRLGGLWRVTSTVSTYCIYTTTAGRSGHHKRHLEKLPTSPEHNPEKGLFCQVTKDECTSPTLTSRSVLSTSVSIIFDCFPNRSSHDRDSARKGKPHCITCLWRLRLGLCDVRLCLQAYSIQTTTEQIETGRGTIEIVWEQGRPTTGPRIECRSTCLVPGFID